MIRISIRNFHFYAAAALFLFPSFLYAWGPVGHATVAYIAQDHLTPKAARAVKALLAPDTMAWVSSWADDIIEQRPETADWHHIDLDVRKNLTQADIPDYCARGNCVVGQIEFDVAVLKNPKDSLDQKREALKFLIHFVGDIHQPLHCANDDDRGGNEKYLSLHPQFGVRHPRWVRLHSYWDHLLEEKTREVPRDLATRLEARITPAEKLEWQKGGAPEWAFESYLIAKNDIYEELPAGPMRQGWDVIPLPADYRRGGLRLIVDEQLEKAGLRLAIILNQVFQ